MIRHIDRQPLNRGIQIEQQRAIAIITQHALNPEERRDPRAARDRAHVVKAGRRREHHMTTRQFHAVDAVRVLDHELPAVILLRFPEKKRR